MRKLQKIKFKELVDQSTTINVDEMRKIAAGIGISLFEGCLSYGICSSRTTTPDCSGSATCVSGVVM